MVLSHETMATAVTTGKSSTYLNLYNAKAKTVEELIISDIISQIRYLDEKRKSINQEIKEFKHQKELEIDKIDAKLKDLTFELARRGATRS